MSCAAMNTIATADSRACGLIPRRRIRSAIVPSSKAPKLIATAMMKRRVIRLARSTPSTSVSHGAAHNPCNAQADPTQVAEGGANLQKRGSV